jgi:hypothetical protein
LSRLAGDSRIDFACVGSGGGGVADISGRRARGAARRPRRHHKRHGGCGRTRRTVQARRKALTLNNIGAHYCATPIQRVVDGHGLIGRRECDGVVDELVGEVKHAIV